MKYGFTDKDGKEVEVELEKWAWCVGYKDGTELRQFDAEGRFHQFGEVKQEEVEVLIMYETEGERRFDLYLPKDRATQVFHFYRNFVFRAARPDEVRAHVWCFGWKDKETGLAEYHYILPSGNMVVAAAHDSQILGSVLIAEMTKLGLFAQGTEEESP